MGVTVCDVKSGSLAHKAGIAAGDVLESINGHPIQDVLDYDFYATEKKLSLVVLQGGKQQRIKLKKGQYEDLGLLFETYLIDAERSCRNKCIFCFIDQLPDGMRDTLYFKDDDERLSFLFGNYITLTNTTQHDIDRIIAMKISPINISVHTTNPELRCRMMHNRFAGQSLSFLHQLAKAGIKLNCQLVLCPGINDGEELVRSLTELSALYPSVQSIACVPVGLTRFRDHLPQLEPYHAQTAQQVIDTVEAYSQAFFQTHGVRIAFAADEFYIKANRPIPDAAYYGEFNQLENGVGMLALLKQEFEQALDHCEIETSTAGRVSIACGVDAKPYLEQLVKMAQAQIQGIDCNVYGIRNDFFGHSITVSGLVTGQDLIAQLKGKSLGRLLIPASMLRSEKDVFLDDVTLDQVERALGVSVQFVESDGWELLDRMLGI